MNYKEVVVDVPKWIVDRVEQIASEIDESVEKTSLAVISKNFNNKVVHA